MANRNHGIIAYFSMEIGLVSDMPTYAGGLGVLAGDTIRAAADLKVPMVAVTLLHRKGYFFQRFDSGGRQIEEPVGWAVDDFLTESPQRTSVTIEGRSVSLRAWKYEVAGPGDTSVPVYFLDTDIPENSAWDRTLTHYLSTAAINITAWRKKSSSVSAGSECSALWDTRRSSATT
jgi:glycogen phosphorylase